MNRETDFQRNVKWVIYMTAVVCALCQFILLFSELNYLSGLGIIVNLLYHAAGVACPVFILYLFISENKDKEVYGSYAIGGEIFLGALVSLSIMIKYINKTKDTLAYSTAIVVFLVISMVFELLVGFLFIRYGQDKVTCVLPILTLFVSLILRDAVLSRVDSKLHVKVNIGYDELGNLIGTSFKGSFASGWTFLHAFFFLIFVVCVIIYVDTRFLEELKDNPKDLFTRKTLFGTFTNGLIQEEKQKKSAGHNVQQSASETTKISEPEAVLQIDEKDDSAEKSKENTNTKNSDALHREGSLRKCPDCGSIVPDDAEMCMTCGCPMEQRRDSDMALINCPVCGDKVSDRAVKCVHCGTSLSEKASSMNDKPTNEQKVTVNTKVNEDNKKELIVEKNKKPKGKIILELCVCVLLAAGIIVGFILFKKDKNDKGDEVSQKMIDDINSIGSVTLDDEELINKLVSRYESMTDEQKKQVTNYDELLDAADELERLLEKDNEPISLTTSNAEDYLRINVYSDNMEEDSRRGLGWTDYYYYFDVTSEVSPLKSYYYENVTVTIEWELKFGGLYATYDVKLDDSGNGAYSQNQQYKAAYKFNDYRNYFSVKGYKIVKISGKVYKRKPQ